MARHDARLVPAALVAWMSAAAVLAYGVPPAEQDLAGEVAVDGWVIGIAVALGVVALAAACAVWSAARRGHEDRWRAGIALAASAALVAAVAASLHGAATAAAERSLVEGGDVVAHVVAGESRGLGGGESSWMVEATVLDWSAGDGGPPPAGPAGPAEDASAATRRGGPHVAIELARPPVRGERLTLEMRAERSDRGGLVAWGAAESAPATWDALARWRASLLDATEPLPSDVRGLVRGMVVGDTTSMPVSQVEDMRRAGLAHLTAVSGAHFAIVIAGVGAALRRMRAPRVLAAAAVGVAAATFGAIVGPEPSVVRALAMAGAVTAGLAWGRPARGLPALAAGVVTLVVAYPPLALELGFAMSVSAVAAIVLWAPRLARGLARVLPPRLATVVSVPLAAQAAVTPLVIAIDPAVAVYAVPANLLAGVAVLPLMAAGMATLALAPLGQLPALPAGAQSTAEAAAHACAVAAGWAARPIAWVAHTAADAPGSSLGWHDGARGVTAAVAVVALALVATWVARGLVRLVAVAGAVAVAVVVVVSAHSLAPEAALRDWDVVVCDVGQGDMMLLRSGPSSAVVVDAGPRPALAAACLEAHGVSEVPLLVLTHPHADHDGGVAGVLERAAVSRAWVSAGALDGAAAGLLATEGVAVIVPAEGERAAAGRATVGVVSSLHGDHAIGHNDASLVVVADADQTSVLALGDIEELAQERLATRFAAGIAVDVVKVAHHGSATQSSALAERIHAHLALISVGADNRYGHPAPETMQLYGARAVVLRTDTCGSIGVAREATDLRWTPCPSAVAR